jgi:LemA protein
VEKAIDLDKDVMKAVAAFRGGRLPDGERNAVAAQIDGAFGRLFPQVEAYPDLKAHASIADAIQQNSYLQKEITAARSLYNDTVNQWNNDIFCWPTNQIVAARAGYTTRIPFTASAKTKAQAREVFF